MNREGTIRRLPGEHRNRFRFLRQLKRQGWSPFLVLAASLLATAAITHEYGSAVETKDRIRFRNTAMRLEHDITIQVETNIALLRGATGLFAANPDLTRAQFAKYVDRLRIQENYPGLLGIGWSVRIPAERRNAFVRTLRENGFSSFRIWPEGERDEYYSIVYLEPLDRRNQAAIGYDMFSEPVRRAAMERARDTGEPAVSGRITLVQEIDDPKQAGFLIYAPVYTSGSMPSTAEDRKKQLIGFVYMPCRSGDWFASALGKDAGAPVSVEVYDSEPGAAHLLYGLGRSAENARFSTTSQVEVGGRRWALVFTSAPGFENQSDRQLVPIVFACGLLLSLLLAGITWGEARALRAADESAGKLRRSRRELAAQREWLRTTLTSIGDAVIATDLTGRVTYLNSRAEELTGWKSDQAHGIALKYVFRASAETTGEREADPVQLVLQTNEPVALPEGTVLRAKDGTERPIDDSAAPIRDANGNVTGVVLVFRDVTERKRVEEARRQAAAEVRRIQQRLSLALGAAGMGVWEWDITADRIWESEEMPSLFGQPPEWRHTDFASFLGSVKPEDRAIIQAALEKALDDCNDYQAEYRVERPDGSIRWLTDRGKVMCEEGGKATGLIAVTLDITARRRTEEAMKDASRSKDIFVATLAHELRNPLATIGNALNVMKFAGSSGKPAERMRDLAERQMAQLVRLVDDLLDVSRITEGKIKLQKARIDLVPLLREAIESARSSIAAAGHHLTVDLPVEPVIVHGDMLRLSQVVNNLLSNAAKYTRQDGKIVVQLRCEGGEAVVRVRDNGIGIAPETLPYIFDLFMQAHPEGEYGRTGMGIGLTLVRNLVDLHDGRVEACSDGPGKGSEFVVRLPLAAPDATAAIRPPESVVPVQIAESGVRVLVVDDNRDSAESVAMLLECLGNPVEIGYDGETALEKVSTFQPDLVLLDIGLPGMDGYETARRLRAGHPNLMLVAMTGWGGDEDRKHAFDAGFDHHLLKPVDMAALSSLLAQIASPA